MGHKKAKKNAASLPEVSHIPMLSVVHVVFSHNAHHHLFLIYYLLSPSAHDCRLHPAIIWGPISPLFTILGIPGSFYLTVHVRTSHSHRAAGFAEQKSQTCTCRQAAALEDDAAPSLAHGARRRSGCCAVRGIKAQAWSREGASMLRRLGTVHGH